MEIDHFIADACEPHALVREEDIQLVLTPPAELRVPRESLDELARAAAGTAGHAPGTVVVRPGRPLRLLAIVHDVDRDPSWREEWIVAATEAVFRETHWRGLTSIAMPLLGTVHGRLAPGRGAELLAAVLEQPDIPRPRALWLERADAAIVQWLRSRLT